MLLEESLGSFLSELLRVDLDELVVGEVGDFLVLGFVDFFKYVFHS